MLRGPFRHKWFAWFTAAVGLGSVGDEVSKLAMPLLVLGITHSLAAAATLRILQMVPYVLFGAFAGALIDRAEKRRLLIAADGIRLVVTALIPLSVDAGMFSLELVYVIAFALGSLDVVWGITTDFTVVPSLVNDNELTAANAAYIGADRIARVGGPALGGLAIGAFGLANALWVSAFAYVPTMLVFVLMPAVYESERPSTAFTIANVRDEIREGFHHIFDSAILRSLMILMFITNLGNTGLQPLLLYVLSEENHVDPTSIGVALSIAGIVQISGSALAPVIARGRPLGHTMLAVVLAGSFAPIVAGLVRDWRLVVAAIAGRQTTWAAHVVYAYLPRQREVPSRLRGRVNGSFRTIVLIANASSPALLSGIQGALSSSAAFAAAGVLGILATAITYFSPLREYDIREAPEELANVEPVAEKDAEAGAAAI